MADDTTLTTESEEETTEITEITEEALDDGGGTTVEDDEGDDEGDEGDEDEDGDDEGDDDGDEGDEGDDGETDDDSDDEDDEEADADDDDADFFGQCDVADELQQPVLDLYRACKAAIPSASTIGMLTKAVAYDKDLKLARRRGVKQGRNQIIDMLKKRRNIPLSDNHEPIF